LGSPCKALRKGERVKKNGLSDFYVAFCTGANALNLASTTLKGREKKGTGSKNCALSEKTMSMGRRNQTWSPPGLARAGTAYTKNSIQIHTRRRG